MIVYYMYYMWWDFNKILNLNLNLYEVMVNVSATWKKVTNQTYLNDIISLPLHLKELPSNSSPLELTT
jgi:hypothetical protein